MEAAINVLAVLLRDWIFRDAQSGFVVTEDMRRLMIAALNTEITDKHFEPDRKSASSS